MFSAITENSFWLVEIMDAGILINALYFHMLDDWVIDSEKAAVSFYDGVTS